MILSDETLIEIKSNNQSLGFFSHKMRSTEFVFEIGFAKEGPTKKISLLIQSRGLENQSFIRLLQDIIDRRLVVDTQEKECLLLQSLHNELKVFKFLHWVPRCISSVQDCLDRIERMSLPSLGY